MAWVVMSKGTITDMSDDVTVFDLDEIDHVLPNYLDLIEEAAANALWGKLHTGAQRSVLEAIWKRRDQTGWPKPP